MIQKISNRFLILIFLCLVVSGLAKTLSQTLAGSEGTIEPRILIDKPTAGMMKRGSFSFGIDFFQFGGVLTSLNAGINDKLSFGISYGGNNIIGSQNVEWNKSPGVNIKFRLLDEQNGFPAVSLGFDSQGKEDYLKNFERYRVKSLGFYAVGSKNIEFLGYLSIHGGINRSLENKDSDNNVNAFLGFEKTLGNDVSFVGEYDFATNDDNPPFVIAQTNRFNLGIRWNIGDGFMLGANLKAIGKRNNAFKIGNRTILVEYIKIF